MKRLELIKPLHLCNTQTTLKIYFKAHILNNSSHSLIRSQVLGKSSHHWFNINDLKGKISDGMFH